MNSFCKKASSSDRHSNVRGKDRRIVLPIGCADRVFELRKRLGHRTAGQTVEWLLIQAKASVDAVLNTNPAAPKNQNGPKVILYPYLSRTTFIAPAAIIYPPRTNQISIPSNFLQETKCPVQFQWPTLF